MVQVEWLIEAKNDLRDIYDYIASDSKRYARLQVTRIKEEASILKVFPLAGKVVVEINDPKIRELVSGHYRIIYRIVESDKIHVLLVHHGARRIDNRLNKIDP